MIRSLFKEVMALGSRRQFSGFFLVLSGLASKISKVVF